MKNQLPPKRRTSIGSVDVWRGSSERLILSESLLPRLLHALLTTLRLGQHLPFGDCFCHRLERPENVLDLLMNT